jgi:hypothetical protein
LFPVIRLPVTFMPVAPSSATLTPDSGNGMSSPAAHALVLLLMRLLARWNSPAGSGKSAKTATPAQLPWIEFAKAFPCGALR